MFRPTRRSPGTRLGATGGVPSIAGAGRAAPGLARSTGELTRRSPPADPSAVTRSDPRSFPFHKTQRRGSMNLLYIILIVVLVLALLGFVGGRGRW